MKMYIMRLQLRRLSVSFFMFQKSKLFFSTYNEKHTEYKNSLISDELLKKDFEKIAIGNPPRAKINKIINFLIKSNILNKKWTHLEIVDEIYKRKIDKDLLFHLNVLYGLGSKGLHLKKKALISPSLFLPLLDFEQFKYLVKVIQLADKERQLKVHEEKEFIETFFKK